VSPAERVARRIAGVAVLLSLGFIGIVLVPSYVANWKLQRYVNELIDDPATASQPLQSTRDKVIDRAAALGLPLRADNVHVTPSQNAIKIEALYVVHVDVFGYAVDLHFRPAAGGT
jgi:hypothetical protein